MPRGETLDELLQDHSWQTERSTAYDAVIGESGAPGEGPMPEGGLKPAEALKPAWRAAEEAFQCFVRAINILQARR